MIDLRPVFFICGILLTGLAVVMTIPAIVDGVRGDPDWLAFLEAAGITLFVGGALILTSRAEIMRLNLRQAFAFTTFSWVVVAAFGALPFAFSKLGMSYTDALFESISGITTTGSTVITKLDTAPPGILLWRAILQWLGGIGIIVFALAILPMLKVGGMQLFRVEAFDTPEKVLPRAAQLAASIGGIYVGFTCVAAISLKFAGMNLFDAICHAMTAIATGGFSTRDLSLGAFPDHTILWIVTITMIAGSLPFVFYIDAVRGNPRPLLRDSQVHWFFALIGTASIAAFLWLIFGRGFEPGFAATHAFFNVVSVMTGTGYTSDNFDAWGGFTVVMMFTLMFIGGCAGSTTCGIKIFRFQIAYAVGRTQVRRLMQPHGVFIPYYNRRPVSDEVASAVMGFFFLFVVTFAALALGLAALGLDTITALSGAATTIANVGPGLGPVIGPAGNFAALPDAAKWLMSVGMLLGRLEIFTVLILFTPIFWRS